MRIAAAAALLALAVSVPGQAAVKEDPVTYKDGDTTMKGFVVYDDAKKGRRPGVIVIHEWWGITKHTREQLVPFEATYAPGTWTSTT